MRHTASTKKKSASKSAMKSEPVDVETLPAVKVGRQKISNYAVVGQTNETGQLAHFAVLAWTPEEYDYELQEYNVPQLYIFRREDDRNEFQQTLFDESPNLLLQAYKFDTPIRIKSIAPIKRT
jgi:hypothetical protein